MSTNDVCLAYNSCNCQLNLQIFCSAALGGVLKMCLVFKNERSHILGVEVGRNLSLSIYNSNYQFSKKGTEPLPMSTIRNAVY